MKAGFGVAWLLLAVAGCSQPSTSQNSGSADRPSEMLVSNRADQNFIQRSNAELVTNGPVSQAEPLLEDECWENVKAILEKWHNPQTSKEN